MRTEFEETVREMSDETATSNQWIQMRRNNVSWKPVGGPQKLVAPTPQIKWRVPPIRPPRRKSRKRKVI